MSFHANNSCLTTASVVNRAAFPVLLIFCIFVLGMGSKVCAQVPTPITSSGLNTQVSAPVNLPAGTVQYNITGGTRPGNGPNLFHSFGQFGIPTNNIANFLNDSGLATANILGRVTGGNPSNIFGTIQTTGFGGANLFLMNPAGIVFGPNASLNVGGSVSFTTANYLRLTDGAQFNAIPGSQDAAISSAPVASFGFLGSNPGAITIQGGQFSILQGQGISLVGGNITVQSGTLDSGTAQPARISAPGGQINLVSAASSGEVAVSNFQPTPNMALGTITLSQGTTLNVSANSAGTIRIRGGQFTITDATISADSSASNGAPIAIDVNVAGNVAISDTRGVPALTARTTGSGNAGEISIASNNLDATSTALPLFALLDTHTSDAGKGGNVSITTKSNLNVTGNRFGRMFFIDSGTIGPGAGHGGDVVITANNVVLQETRINTGDFIARQSFGTAAGSGGDVTITSDTLSMNHALIATDGFFEGTAGDIKISARDIQMTSFSQLSLLEFEGGGTLRINADRLSADSTQFESEMVSGQGGGITITAKIVELKNGTSARSQTVGDGTAGNIQITATDHLTMADDPTTLGAKTRPTGLFTNSLGDADLGNLGNAGTIVITTPQLNISGGARIDSTTQSSGRGGDVLVTASNSVSIQGERPTPVIETEIFGLGSSRPSGIFTRTVGSEFCTGPCGDAGRISITTGSMNQTDGAQINSGSISTGRGGDITINAGQFVSINNNASISARSLGPANAGNISINAGSQFLSNNASVTTQASQASGGNITVQATDAIRLVNSQINTSVQGGPTTSGGNITIDPAIMTLQNSQILAQAVQGQGGNIHITAGTFLADQTSLVSASSQFGLSGSVDIQSPVSNLSGTLATLAQRPLQAQPLLTQRCAAQVNGQLSSLVVTGRETLPTEPGGWLMSPLVMMASDEPAPQAYRTSNQGSEASHRIEEYLQQLSDQPGLSSRRGVWDRETGCGS